MGLKEDVQNIEDKTEKISVAMEMLQFSKEQNKQLEKANKRLFIIILILVIGLLIVVGYLAYVLNDINTETKTIDIDSVEQIDNSHIKIGNDEWEESN